jgi:outer membrane protein assembly factor BamB
MIIPVFSLFIIISNPILLNSISYKISWNITTGGSISESPCIWDEKVYFGSGDYKLYCINAITGSMVWTFKTGDRVSSSPCIWDEKVYFGSDDYKLYCIDAGIKNNGTIYPSISGMDTISNK